jgi:hypothetical protein
MADGANVAPTLFERVATRLGYDSIRPAIPFSPHPLVLFAVLLVTVDFLVVQVAKEALGYTAILFQNPAWLILPSLVLVGAFAVVFLRRRYARALHEIDYLNRTDNPERFHTLAPLWLSVAFYVVAIVHRAWRVSTFGLEGMVQVGGVPEVVGVALIGLGYNIVLVEFLVAYAGIMLLLPRRIRRTDFKLDFLDPEGLGGLRPIGELAKTAYYFIVVGLVGFLVYVYAPVLLGEFFQNPYTNPGIVTNVLFTVAWLLTIATMAYGLAQIHWFMKRERRAELRRLNRRVHDVVDDRFDVDEFEITDEETFEDLRQRMEYVDGTREYPTTFTMWSQIAISVLLPQVMQLAVQTTL